MTLSMRSFPRASVIRVVFCAGLLGVLGACGPPAPSTVSVATSSGPAASTKQSASAEPEQASDASLRGEAVVITKRSPAVGDTATITRAQRSELRGWLKGEHSQLPFESTETKDIVRVEECLAVAANACSRIKVVYAKRQHAQTTRSPRPDPLSGKTFIVAARGEEVVVTTPDGGDPGTHATDEVKRDYATLPFRSRLMDALPSKPIRVGDSMDRVAALLLAIATDGEHAPDDVIASGRVKAIREENGKKIITLSVTLLLVASESKVSARFDASGTVELRADVGLPLHTELSGPVIMDFGASGRLDGKIAEDVKTSYSF